MARKHLLHVKSSSVTNGNPKLPLPSDIEYGELAINYADGYETISIKNSNNEIVTFPNSNTIEQAEETIAQALSDLDERVTANRRSIDTLSENEDSLENLKEVTYDELVQMVNESELVPGTLYRITDYHTVVGASENFISADHQFDIIVNAISENELSEDAHAISHDGETYFRETVFNEDVCTLWTLRYSLIPNLSKYSWLPYGTYTGGPKPKGAIYYMKDEWGNEAPYDFKNIMFRRKKISGVTNEFHDDAGKTISKSLVYDLSFNPFAVGCVSEEKDYYFPGAVNFVQDSGNDEGSEWYYTFTGIKVNGYTSYTIDDEYREVSAADYNTFNATEQGLYVAKSEDIYSILPEYIDLTNEEFSDIEGDLVHITYQYNSPKITEYEIYDISTKQQYYISYTLGRPNVMMKETCAGNIIKESWTYEENDGIYVRKSYMLPENVFIGLPNDVIRTTTTTLTEDPNNPGEMIEKTTTTTGWLNSVVTNIVGNYIDYGSFGNTFVGWSENNTIGKNAYFNIFGKSCSSNNLGNYAQYNVFGGDSSQNKFGDRLHTNNFGIGCNGNIFGNNITYNVINSGSNENVVGNNFNTNYLYGSQNTIGSYCRLSNFIMDWSYAGDNTSSCAFGYIDYTTTPYTNNRIMFLDARGFNYKSFIYGNYCTLNVAATYVNIPLNANYVTVLAGEYRDINLSTTLSSNVQYPQYVSFDSNGNIAVWCPADHLIPPASV